MRNPVLPISLLTSMLATTAMSDQVINEDLIVKDNLCVGSLLCADGEVFGDDDIRVRSSKPQIAMMDSSVSGAKWLISVDDNFTGVSSAFSVRNDTGNTYPFVITEDAPTSALWIGPDGALGLGTSLPQAAVHVVEPSNPRIRLQQTGAEPYSWEMGATQNSFYLFDKEENFFPLVIEAAAPTDAITVQNTGNIGLGTGNPGAPLELATDGTFNFFRITATGAAVNKNVDITFTGGPLGTGQLRYNIVDGDNQEMSLDADGNMVLDGTLTTSGPTCAGGCDRVFDDGYDLLSIDMHAELMLANQHLPAMGPTLPGQPVNITEQVGNMLNELEHAHLYIAQLQNQLRSEQANSALQARRIDRLIARLDVIDTVLTKVD